MLDLNAKEAAADNLRKSHGSSDKWFNHEYFVESKLPPENPFIVVPLPQGEEKTNFQPRVREERALKNFQKDKSTGDWSRYEDNKDFFDKPVPKIGPGETPREIMKKDRKSNNILAHDPRVIPIKIENKRNSSAFNPINFETSTSQSFRPPRTHSESRKTFIKSNQSKLFSQNGENLKSQNSPYRCPTEDSRKNQMRNTMGSDMSNILGMTKATDEVSNDYMFPHYGVMGSTPRKYQTQGQRGFLGDSIVKRENIQIYREEYIPKVRLEGEDILKRNTHGKAVKSILGGEEEVYEVREFEDTDVIHKPIDESRKISYQQKKGSMNSLIGGEAESTIKKYPNKIQPRSGTRDEIREIIENQSEVKLQDVIQTDGDLGKVRSVYRSLRNKDGYRAFMENRGEGMSEILPHTSNLKTASGEQLNKLPPVRLRYGADDIKLKHSGSVMANILAQKN